MILLSHGACELIHDSAVASVKIILSILPDQRHFHHGQILKAKRILKHQPCQDF